MKYFLVFHGSKAASIAKPTKLTLAGYVVFYNYGFLHGPYENLIKIFYAAPPPHSSLYPRKTYYIEASPGWGGGALI